MLGARMFDTLEAIATSAREDDHPAYYLTRGGQSNGFQRSECAHADTSGITEQTCSRRVETTAIGTIRRSDVAGSSDFGTTSAIEQRIDVEGQDKTERGGTRQNRRREYSCFKVLSVRYFCIDVELGRRRTLGYLAWR